MEPNLKHAVPFFMVKNIEQSLDFYVRDLGFEMKLYWKPKGKIAWCWLERDGVPLMLQEYVEGSMPREKLGVGVAICFLCNDALRLYKEFLEKGLSLSEPFVGNNLWVVQLKDPDGYNILFESPTNVPEDTLYSEWIART